MFFKAIHTTGFYLNPLNASNQTLGCKGTSVFDHFLVYWIGPCVSASLTSVIYYRARKAYRERKAIASAAEKEKAPTPPVAQQQVAPITDVQQRVTSPEQIIASSSDKLQSAPSSDKQQRPSSFDKQQKASSSDEQQRPSSSDRQQRPSSSDKQRPSSSDKQQRASSSDKQQRASSDNPDDLAYETITSYFNRQFRVLLSGNQDTREDNSAISDQDEADVLDPGQKQKKL